MKFHYFLSLILLLHINAVNSFAKSQWDGYIFTLNTGHLPTEVEEYFTDYGFSVDIKLLAHSIRAYKITHNIELRRPVSFEALLSNCPMIDLWQKNYFLHFRDKEPNDPRYSELWYLDKISMPQAWDQTTGSVLSSYHQPVIGILEPGLDVSQLDFEGIFFENPAEIPNNGIDDDENGYVDDFMGWNFNDNTGEHPVDPSSHGDGVIGVAAARGNNGIGIAGINWSAKVLPVSLSNRATNAITIEAYEYFYQMRKRYNDTNGEEGAFIVTTNSSFGEDGLFESDVPLYCEMFNKMGDVGILSVGATTNSETNVDNFGDIPSDCSSDQLIIVTSIDNTDDIRGGFGSKNVDIAAPGTDILTMASNGDFITDSGTSFATPQVAGLISLAYTLPLDSLQSAITNNPSLVLNKIKNCILETATPASDLGERTSSGGYLNADACLKCVSEQFQPGNGQSPLKISNLYPNASKDEITFEFSTIDFSTNIHYSIVDQLGKIIAEGDMNPSEGNTGHLNISQLSAGAYILLLEQSGHKTHWKFVKI